MDLDFARERDLQPPFPQTMEPAIVEDDYEEWCQAMETDTIWTPIPGARDTDTRKTLAWALGGVSVAPLI